MSYGLMVWDSAGVVRFDSRNAQGGVCMDAKEVAPGASITLNYPTYAGRTLEVVAQFVGSIFTSVSYAAGYPSVTLSCPASFIAPLLFLVFIY